MSLHRFPSHLLLVSCSLLPSTNEFVSDSLPALSSLPIAPTALNGALFPSPHSAEWSDFSVWEMCDVSTLVTMWLVAYKGTGSPVKQANLSLKHCKLKREKEDSLTQLATRNSSKVETWTWGEKGKVDSRLSGIQSENETRVENKSRVNCCVTNEGGWEASFLSCNTCDVF